MPALRRSRALTVVLVHGAFASPAGWGEVTDALHKDGYQTATPTLAMESVVGDSRSVTIRSALDSILGDKILVEHSYGGFVITNAASGRTDVRGLVYTAAYVPDSGETINDLGVGYTPGTFLNHLILAPSYPLVIDAPQSFPDDFAQDLNPKLAAEIAAEQRPNEPWPLRHSIGPRRLARPPVVVRSLRPRPRNRPCPGTVHGSARWIDHRRLQRREPRGGPHALLGALREADRTSDRRNGDMTQSSRDGALPGPGLVRRARRSCLAIVEGWDQLGAWWPCRSRRRLAFQTSSRLVRLNAGPSAHWPTNFGGSDGGDPSVPGRRYRRDAR